MESRDNAPGCYTVLYYALSHDAGWYVCPLVFEDNYHVSYTGTRFPFDHWSLAIGAILTV